MNIFEICTGLVLVGIMYLLFRYMLYYIQYGSMDPDIDRLIDVVHQQASWTPNVTYISEEDEYASEMSVMWVSEGDRTVFLYWRSEVGDSGNICETIEIDPGNRMMGGALYFERTRLIKFCPEAGYPIEDNALTIEQRVSAERLYRLVHKFVNQLSR